MELKLLSITKFAPYGILLIVPYGIETGMVLRYIFALP